MTWNPSSPVGERLQEKLTARRLLAQMSQFERLAELADDTESVQRPNMRPAEVEFWKDRHAALYRELIGAPIEQRHVLRAALEQIAQHGRRRVSDLLAELHEASVLPQAAGARLTCP